ncbi:FGGY family carbohydrate kinase [Halomonas alkalisoli]|uniref:FGGY family carbohydrate kinase n=1 Tax=Halomonas alkalisoli TaxID=2907158 RepID=UPI001EFF39D6|nr:FGGY family carbohydrate kinase [Halomonas alkalisoli]MCE9684463.1 hypothetical protein [Halomonas alkalisoli]
MSSYLLSIDQGTTSSRAILFDRELRPVAISQQELPQSFPADGWVEHDPESIWESVQFICRDVLRKGNIRAADLAGVGITNQRESTLVYRLNGRPTYAIEGSIFVAGATVQWLRDGLQRLLPSGNRSTTVGRVPCDV